MARQQCIADVPATEHVDAYGPESIMQYRQAVDHRLAKVTRPKLTRAEWHRRWRLRKIYNMSLADYWQYYAEQDGKCGICGKEETAIRKGTHAELGVDHDHKTGKVRGLLCSRCNRAIGLLDDDLVLLKACVAWLETTADERHTVNPF